MRLNSFAGEARETGRTAHAKDGQQLGQGTMELTCRQYQARFKRAGQFWTQAGDESFMCLETFRRNDRRHSLFPHARGVVPSRS